ncbi:hypothetical protein BST61_g67 [Cercospora zeina]
MTPNVSRLLIRYAVDKIIGDDLVQCKNINMRNTKGEIIQRTELYPKTVREFGFPWWMVHRHRLHTGLAEAARRHGVEIVVDSRVVGIEYERADIPVEVATARGQKYTFDLVIGSDGLRSVVRKTLFPDVVPRSPTNNAAYRAVLPYDYALEKGYIIQYPIAAGRDWNAAMSHYRDKPVTDVEDDCDMSEMIEYFKDLDPRILKILKLVPSSKRWPLLITAPLKSWSSPQKNVVLMGDAAHSMVNHLAQGAATSMEDGAFLGRVLSEVVRGVLSIAEAIDIYEKTRMPRVWVKQQASFVMGGIYMADPARAAHRDAASASAVKETSAMSDVKNLNSYQHITGPDLNARSWNLWAAPETVQSIFGYDAEGDADFAVLNHLQQKSPWDEETGVSHALEQKWTGWYLPKEHVGRIARSRANQL